MSYHYQIITLFSYIVSNVLQELSLANQSVSEDWVRELQVFCVRAFILTFCVRAFFWVFCLRATELKFLVLSI